MSRIATIRKQIDPIAQLMQEHDLALVHLAALNRETQSIAEKGFSREAYERILSAVEFIEDEVSVHNKSEEEALFPVLERYVEGPTKLMRDDHKVLKREFVRLRRAVNKVGKERKNKRAAQDLATISKTIVQRFVNHIHKENHILFPLVQKFLTKDALREVARRML
ncbi:MAG: hemerythrin domain-containing protein [Ignavibacteriae bacterium]|nr:hemerythrin domain-containing protein [Ignavibacteriota bacterium]